MGSGIVELVARSGRRVVAIEINQGFLDQGMARLHGSLDKAVTRGKLTDTAREEILARIRPTDDIAAGVADADLVIEAIPERMDLKRTLYAQLDTPSWSPAAAAGWSRSRSTRVSWIRAWPGCAPPWTRPSPGQARRVPRGRRYWPGSGPRTTSRPIARADLVIEAIPERNEPRATLYAELDQACRADAILATNTSSLSVTEIAGGTQGPARVAGLHFFNPAPVMKLVEVISTVLTSPDTAETLALLAGDLGKTPVQVGDRAGFIVNALLVPYLNHAVRLLETAQATREDIDTAATAGLGLPMGPLTLLDLIGLDTSLAVLEVLQAEFGGTRYAPAPLLRKLCDARLFGRKSGRGFYDYRHGTPAAAAAGHDPAAAPVPAEVALIRDPGGLLDELASQITAAGISVVPQPSPRPAWSSWRPTRNTGCWTRPWPRATRPTWSVSTSPAQVTASRGSPSWCCRT